MFFYDILLFTYEETVDIKIQLKEKKKARFPGQNENEWRPGCAQKQKAQRTKGSLCMTSSLGAGGVKNLTKACEYRRVYNKGRLSKGENLWAYILSVPLARTRVGVSVSSRLLKKAVERNKLKRIIKEWFAQSYKSDCQAGADIVIVAKQALVLGKSGSACIRRELAGLMGKTRSLS